MSVYPPEQQESDYLHTALLEYQRDTERLTVELTAAQAELDRRHEEYSKALNRRVDVENVLASVAAGKRDPLTREECKALAQKLGNSS